MTASGGTVGPWDRIGQSNVPERETPFGSHPPVRYKVFSISNFGLFTYGLFTYGAATVTPGGCWDVVESIGSGSQRTLRFPVFGHKKKPQKGSNETMIYCHKLS
jgi:hypothetical protein